MSRRFAVQALAEHPDRVVAAASLCGTRLVTKAADSPQLWVPRIVGKQACLRVVEPAPVVPAQVPAQVAVARGAGGAGHRIEHHADTHHGYAEPDAGDVGAAAAERHRPALLDPLARVPR